MHRLTEERGIFKQALGHLDVDLTVALSRRARATELRPGTFVERSPWTNQRRSDRIRALQCDLD